MRRTFTVGRVAGLTALAALAGGGLLALGRRRERRARERLRRRLSLATASRDGASRRDRHRDRLADLPTPVRRYLDVALPETEDARTGSVRVEQAGELRVGGPESRWHPFTATHHATVRPPGFVWDATVAFLPAVPVRVRDALVDGEASSRVALFGAVPLGGARGSPELAEAALQRYLAEAVWYPSALLDEAVEWEGLDDRSARATLTDGETTASLTFHFAEDGTVERVHTERRYRAVDGGFEPTPWTGLWRDYEERAGVVVPTAGDVVWHLPAGDFRAWRGRVRAVENGE